MEAEGVSLEAAGDEGGGVRSEEAKGAVFVHGVGGGVSGIENGACVGVGVYECVREHVWRVGGVGR